MFEDELPKWQEQIEAARRTQERLGPLAAEKAKQYETLTLEQALARWAEVMRDEAGWERYDDDLKADVMALYQAIGAKMRERGRVLRAAGFDYGEPMQ
ncbi:MAG: hypothetical protein MUC51_02330 [Anaerolineae bacterium]|jgi:hypothetical protein|nr:hypothetical protein [Anaerolineae bacterium]